MIVNISEFFLLLLAFSTVILVSPEFLVAKALLKDCLKYLNTSPDRPANHMHKPVYSNLC